MITAWSNIDGLSIKTQDTGAFCIIAPGHSAWQIERPNSLRHRFNGISARKFRRGGGSKRAMSALMEMSKQLFVRILATCVVASLCHVCADAANAATKPSKPPSPTPTNDAASRNELTWLECQGTALLRKGGSNDPETTAPWDRGEILTFTLIINTQSRKAGWYEERRHAIRWIDQDLDEDAPDFVLGRTALDPDNEVIFPVRYDEVRFTDAKVEFVCQHAFRCSDAGMQGGHQVARFVLDRSTLEFNDLNYQKIGPRRDGFYALTEIKTRGRCSQRNPERVEKTAL